ncbi:MAG: hypothetical protein D6785_10570, partial [Planctomycetota bacterium]
MEKERQEIQELERRAKAEEEQGNYKEAYLLYFQGAEKALLLANREKKGKIKKGLMEIALNLKNKGKELKSIAIQAEPSSSSPSQDETPSPSSMENKMDHEKEEGKTSLDDTKISFSEKGLDELDPNECEELGRTLLEEGKKSEARKAFLKGAEKYLLQAEKTGRTSLVEMGIYLK